MHWKKLIRNVFVFFNGGGGDVVPYQITEGVMSWTQIFSENNEIGHLLKTPRNYFWLPNIFKKEMNTIYLLYVYEHFGKCSNLLS